MKDVLRHPPDRDVSRSLSSILEGIESDSIDTALRHVDRAWRFLPDFSDIFAPVYARLLALDGTDVTAALGMLHGALDSSPDPEMAALVVHCLLRSQRIEEARQRLTFALNHYCIEPEGLLACVAGEALRHPGFGGSGWIGRGSDLSLIGELAPHEPNLLEVSVDGGTPFTQILSSNSRSGSRRFHVAPPPLGSGARLTVSSRDATLLGGDTDLHLDFALDGRVGSRGRIIRGWARLGWSPAAPLTLRLAAGNGAHIELRSRPWPSPSWHWPFTLDLRKARLPGNEFTVSARLPDGRWQPLPDSPLILEHALRTRASPLGKWRVPTAPERPRTALDKRSRTLDIIIPVYGGRTETLACIDSVLGTLSDDARVVVVDDASEDAELGAALDALEATGRIQLLRNAKNLGFVASVNRGLRLHPTRDALILNSDTLVFGDWHSRLRAAAYSAPKVGTVTPLTNSGSIASYPQGAGGTLDAQTADALQHLAASTLSGVRVDIPVGVGFCLYVRRDCLRAVGELDAAVFGKGYGEETDFCLRARAKGWSHCLAADVFVYHAGGLSFAGRRGALLDRSQRLLNLRHPGFERFVASFLAQDPLHAVRRRLDERRLVNLGQRFVLLVTLAMFGGVDRYVAERGRALKAEGLMPLVLRPTAAGKPRRCELWTEALEVPNLQFDIPRELGALQQLLGELNIAAVEIQHFIGLDARVIEVVRALRVGYDVVVHDYSWICPRVTLIDGTNRYCGEPAVSVCHTCVRRNGSKLTDKISVSALRERSALWLKAARRVTAPSADAAARLQKHIEELAVEVRPHTVDVIGTPLARRPSRRKALRVALIGAIGTHKGYRILLACARDARRRQLPIEFVVIGYTEHDEPLLATGKVFITGQYSEPEATHLIQREQPDLAWLPSVWPETWCYALDYALAAGLPVAAFDIGAIAERLRAAGTGELMPLLCAASQINDRLLALGVSRAPADFTIVEDRQTLMPEPLDDAKMTLTSTDGMFMAKANGTPTPQSTKDDGLSASVQVLPLPSGLYLFSVKSASAPPSAAQGQLALPAMHVGLGPGVKSDQVEFIAGPSTHGAWLFSTTDLLVTKINGAGATLILTSVRAPGGEVLSIQVERLEERAAAPAVDKVAAVAAQAPAAAGAKPVSTSLFDAAGKPLPLPVHIVAHIRTRGDMNFAHLPWAGRVAPGLWIESFSIQPLDRFGAGDIEYKGLTGSGFETPWISDNKMCGTKAMSTPLVGFAIRLKPSPAAASFDCEYSGYFQSGIVVGPMRNGAPCRSSVANDSLEGVQVRIVPRVGAALTEPKRKVIPAPVATVSAGKPKAAAAPKPVPHKSLPTSVTPKPVVHDTQSKRSLRRPALSKSPTRRQTSRRP